MGEIDSYLGELLGLPVHTNMKTDPPKVPMSDPVSTIVDIMIRENIGAVIALDDGQPIGILTARARGGPHRMSVVALTVGKLFRLFLLQGPEPYMAVTFVFLHVYGHVSEEHPSSVGRYLRV